MLVHGVHNFRPWLDFSPGHFFSMRIRGFGDHCCIISGCINEHQCDSGSRFRFVVVLTKHPVVTQYVILQLLTFSHSSFTS